MQLRVGGKYFFKSNGFFAGGLVGAAEAFNGGEKSFGFTFEPILGIELGIIDFTLGYEDSKFKDYNVTTVSFSIGYHFPL